jgi:hypothetical protein
MGRCSVLVAVAGFVISAPRSSLTEIVILVTGHNRLMIQEEWICAGRWWFLYLKSPEGI